MKLFRTKFSLTLYLFLFSFNAKATNDTLTIGRVFDWSVGDTLYYRSSTILWVSPAPGAPLTQVTQYGGLLGFTVVSKATTGDTVTYINQCLNTLQLDTVIVDKLLYPITSYHATASAQCTPVSQSHVCDSTTIHCTFDSGIFALNSLQYNFIDIGYFESGYTVTYVEKIGLYSLRYEALEYIPGSPMGTPGGYANELVYYKSDSLFWMDSALYFYSTVQDLSAENTFHLFPNPAAEELTITTTESSETFYVSFFDIAGNLIRTINHTQVNNLTVTVDDLSAGLYLLRFETDKHNSIIKRFVVVR